MTKHCNCQRCNSDRILHVSAKCDDRCQWNYRGEQFEGYAPAVEDVADFDFVRFDVCLDCGQMQGQFPKPELEFDDTDDEC